MNEQNPFLTSPAKAKATTVAQDTSYENNPFFIGIKGAELLFNKAKSVGIFLAILAGLSMISGMFPSPNSGTRSSGGGGGPALPQNATAGDVWNSIVNALKSVPAEVWAFIAIFTVIVIFISLTLGLIIQGISDYTAAQIAKGKEVTLGQAFAGFFKQFWGYVWVMIIVSVKTFLWSLLLFVPGFVMSHRYSLAGILFFDKGLKGNAAVADSLQLTKGAWLTTYAANSLLPMITLGVADLLLSPGTRAILYRQYSVYAKKNEAKPKAHIVSWLTLIVPIVLWLLLITLVGLLIMAVINYRATNP